MTVSFKLVREVFTSRVTLDRRDLKILVEYLQGPFSKLENRWLFEPKSDDSCDVSFFRKQVKRKVRRPSGALCFYG
jgi:coenzyme Q-binding protein COQ10